MVIELLQERLSELDCTLKGWVLYGFPKTRLQAQILDEAGLAPNRVIFLNICHADAAARLNMRRVDPVTGEPYDLCKTLPSPHRWSMCGHSGTGGHRPPGLSECEVSLKLTRHAARREELAKYYEGRVLDVDAGKDEDTVFEQVESFIVNKIPRSTCVK